MNLNLCWCFYSHETHTNMHAYQYNITKTKKLDSNVCVDMNLYLSHFIVLINRMNTIGVFLHLAKWTTKNLCIMYILQLYLYHAVNKNNQQKQKIIYTLLLIRKSNRKWISKNNSNNFSAIHKLWRESTKKNYSQRNSQHMTI